MIKNASYISNQSPEGNKTLTNAAQSLLVLEKFNQKSQEVPNSNVSKQALINRIEEIRKKAQTPVKDVFEEKKMHVPPAD